LFPILRLDEIHGEAIGEPFEFRSHGFNNSCGQNVDCVGGELRKILDHSVE